MGLWDQVDKFKIKRIKPVEDGVTFLPKRANNTDAGIDLCCQESFWLEGGGQRKLIGAGFAMSIPEGYVGRVLPRSGLAVKSGIDVLAGVIDSSYRGEIKVALINHGDEDIEFDAGDRIAQLVIQRVKLWSPVETDTLDNTERGEGGFGSTGA